MHTMQIKEITNIEEDRMELSRLFQEVVAHGASMNFLHPMSDETALRYWDGVLSEYVQLYAAILDDKIAGTVQLHLSDKENGQHRAEIAKLMTHPDARRKGVAKSLLQHAEQAAIQADRWLLLLDTEKDGPANFLYLAEGYKSIGEIPAYSQDPFGEYKDVTVYYKHLK
jgi:ribosomal protein S18 acetylase RimI-like enzyme